MRPHDTGINQKAGGQTVLNPTMRLRSTEPQIVRQGCVCPALVAMGEQLQCNEEVLGLEIHVQYSGIANTECRLSPER